jgi:uncharacterized protein YbjT (DUF2867 family)
MTDRTVLTTGASGGGQGATGRHVTRMLRARGVPVRAFVHRIDERSDYLHDLGAEVVEGDFLDLSSVRAAMDGVSRAYFAYPVQDGLLDATAIFASAARRCGVELVVNLSQLLERSGDQPTPYQRRHWLSEQIFDWAAVGVVHLDATVFYENLRSLAAGSLAVAGVIALPWGSEDTAIPMVAAEDVARVACGILTGPQTPNGTVLPLVGTVVTVREIIHAFNAVLDRAVDYVELTDEQWVDAVSGARINAAALEHLTHLWRHLRTRYVGRPRDSVSEVIERIGGQPPKTLQEFLNEQAEFFTTLTSDDAGGLRERAG